MPQKLKPIDEVIANASPPSREKPREADPQKIEPKPSHSATTKDKR